MIACELVLDFQVHAIYLSLKDLPCLFLTEAPYQKIILMLTIKENTKRVAGMSGEKASLTGTPNLTLNKIIKIQKNSKLFNAPPVAMFKLISTA